METPQTQYYEPSSGNIYIYIQEIGVRDDAVDLGNKYCEWSAALTVQEISPHYNKDKDIKNHMGMGQPLAYAYLTRPRRTPKKNHRNKVTGFATEARKLIIRSKKAKTREGRVEETQQLSQVIGDQDRIQEEMVKLLEGDKPSHEDLGLTQDKWNRTLTGLKYHRTFNIPGLQNLQNILQAGINHVLNLEKLDRKSAVEEWIDKILDASQGYRLAHNFTRGTPKAPPLPSGLWHKGQYLGHPHQIAQVYLQQWGGLWCQGAYPEHQELWTKLKEMIKEYRRSGQGHKELISTEQVRKGIFRLNARTATGVDQWSPAVWRNISDSAVQELTNFLNEVE